MKAPFRGAGVGGGGRRGQDRRDLQAAAEGSHAGRWPPEEGRGQRSKSPFSTLGIRKWSSLVLLPGVPLPGVSLASRARSSSLTRLLREMAFHPATGGGGLFVEPRL